MISSRVLPFVLMPFLVAGCSRLSDEKSPEETNLQAAAVKPAEIKISPKVDLKTEVVKEITDATFEEEVLKSKLAVLVDFWAPWCGACRAVTPEVEEIAKKFQGKLKVVKLNVDKNEKEATRLKIRSLPTLMFFKGEENLGYLTGPWTMNELIPHVEEVIQYETKNK